MQAEMQLLSCFIGCFYCFAVAFRLYDLRQTGFIEREEVSNIALNLVLDHHHKSVPILKKILNCENDIFLSICPFNNSG